MGSGTLTKEGKTVKNKKQEVRGGGGGENELKDKERKLGNLEWDKE